MTNKATYWTYYIIASVFWVVFIVLAKVEFTWPIFLSALFMIGFFLAAGRAEQRKEDDAKKVKKQGNV